jgi:hypothetical protein
MLLREVVVWRDPLGLRGPTDGDTRGEEIDVSTVFSKLSSLKDLKSK